VETCYISIGSNIGNREQNIRLAIHEISKLSTISNVSSIYETEPLGYRNQPYFLNLVCLLETKLSPQQLLESNKLIEQKLLRRPTFKYGPRIIDIDILTYGDSVVETTDLKIPHPQLHRRGFVLIPLAEIASDLIHPSMNKSIATLLLEVPKTPKVDFHSKSHF